MARKQANRRGLSSNCDFHGHRRHHQLIDPGPGAVCIGNMRSATDPQMLRRRRDWKGTSRRQQFALSVAEKSRLRISSQAVFLCLFTSIAMVHGWSSTIRIATLIKPASESLPPTGARRSSLLTSLLEPPTIFPSKVPLSFPSTATPLQMALELQMKQFLPASSHSPSSWHKTSNGYMLSAPSQIANSKNQSHARQSHNHPSMFLTGRFFPAASLVASPSSSGVDFNRAPRIGDGHLENPMHLVPQPRRQRGVLGFDVFELDATRSGDINMEENTSSNNHDSNIRGSGSNSRLHSSRSKVDMETWNDGGETVWEDDREGGQTAAGASEQRFFPAPGLTWRNSPLSIAAASLPSGSDRTINVRFSKQGFSSPSSSPVRLLQHSLPAWFPWIPTKSQIGSLKVHELKEACNQRGLAKTGNKVDLQERLWQWTTEHQQQHQARITGDYLTSWFEDMALRNPTPSSGGITETAATVGPTNMVDTLNASPRRIPESLPSPIVSSTPNSLAEWSRSVDLDKLTQKRQEIHRQKRQGRTPPSSEKRNKTGPSRGDKTDSTKEYLARLTKAMQESPSSPFASNKDVKELYMASKQADQLGEHQLAIQLLESLVDITPSDARIYRRLSRMYREHGNLNVARETIQKGLRRLPNNPWLWHGLGQLELSHGRPALGIKYYQRAITEDPTFAHAYHAWGIYEHSQGRIARAMKILKKGIEYCPTNHRLHHALGDLYRGAKLLKDAERCYRRAIEEGPSVSHGFAYSALACVAYEQGDITEARRWLYKSIETNDGRHAQGWLALAQMEEAEGNSDMAMTICEASIIRYEKGLIESMQRYKRQRENDKSKRHFASGKSPERGPRIPDLPEAGVIGTLENMEIVKNGLLKSVPPYRSGDKFINIFRHWGRLESRYGTFESANRVYERAAVAFPLNYNVPLDWAKYNAKLHNSHRARALFVEACNKASSHHADPYREFANFEMTIGNYQQARKILFRGAQALAQSSDGGLGNRRGLAQLFVTWAVCEWHLGNVPRSEVLFDHALRLTEAGDDGSELRSFILYSMAGLEYFERKEVHLAQHCIGLCLKENSFPGGNAPVWQLLAEIADKIEDYALEEQCMEQVAKCKSSTSPSEGASSFGPGSRSISQILKTSKMEQFIRQEPWTEKLQAVRGTKVSEVGEREGSSFYTSIRFPRHLMSESKEEGALADLPTDDDRIAESDEAALSEHFANSNCK